MDAPLALYRRYRPDTFAEVIGQDHVTGPLRQALLNNRVNHAYLFSGPRGCGKTTSARILARCLNCEKGPTPEPCGECQSCRDLARGGPGSIDVIEIDAASHGGVDDARELRERAFFAPVAARYKIYIVDEAHMVTTQGFNALLKLVEEPPEHLRFIFATTEPEKVIGTIRSRTHHYPFRLVPPKVLQDYLVELCSRERVEVESTALPLVVRAGGGSVRDTLSVLDQLIGGAGAEGVSYAQAVTLLGYTPDSLLDEVVEAFGAYDGARVFAVVDKVIESGQDPRRFAEDVLQRFRDLIIAASVPGAAESGLLEAPPELLVRLTAQAASFGLAALTRAADIVHEGLTDMRGATAPRLLLELICAKVLVPDADDTAHGLTARVERLEQAYRAGGVSVSSSAPAPPSSTSSAPASPPRSTRSTSQAPPSQPAPSQPAPSQAPSSQAPAASQGPAAQAPTVQAPSSQAAGAASPSASAASSLVAAEPAASAPEPSAPQAPAPVASEPEPAAGSAGGGSRLAEVRQRWPEVLEAVKAKRRFTWVLLSQNAHVTDVSGSTLTVGLVNPGARDSFARGSEDILREALSQVFGGTWRVEAVVQPGDGSGGVPARPGSSGPAGSGPSSSAGPGPSSSAGSGPSGSAGSGPSSSAASGPSSSAGSGPSSSAGSGPSGSAGSADWPEPARPGGAAAAGPEPRGAVESGVEPSSAHSAGFSAGSAPGAVAHAAHESAGHAPGAPPANPVGHSVGASTTPAPAPANAGAAGPAAPQASSFGTDGSAGLPGRPASSGPDPSGGGVAVAVEPPGAMSHLEPPPPDEAYDAEIDPETDVATTGVPEPQAELLVREFGAQVISDGSDKP